MRAVILVIVVARAALEAAPDLRANTRTVAGLQAHHICAHSRHLPDDLVAHDEREARRRAPAAGECVQV